MVVSQFCFLPERSRSFCHKKTSSEGLYKTLSIFIMMPKCKPAVNLFGQQLWCYPSFWINRSNSIPLNKWFFTGFSNCNCPNSNLSSLTHTNSTLWAIKLPWINLWEQSLYCAKYQRTKIYFSPCIPQVCDYKMNLQRLQFWFWKQAHKISVSVHARCQNILKSTT